MKKFSKIAAIVAAVLIVAVSATALAAAYGSPAEIVASLTGKTTQSVIEERTQTGKTYGTIANEAGKLTEFKAAMLELKKEILSEKVAAGSMTQERADAIIAAMEENQEICDGTGSAKIGRGMGAGFGSGAGQGCGLGNGQGTGRTQRGIARGQGTCTGCIY